MLSFLPTDPNLELLFDPALVQGLKRSGTSFGVDGQHGLDQVLATLRNELPVVLWKCELAFEDFLHDLVVVLSVERWVTAQHDVHDDAG